MDAVPVNTCMSRESATSCDANIETSLRYLNLIREGSHGEFAYCVDTSRASSVDCQCASKKVGPNGSNNFHILFATTSSSPYQSRMYVLLYSGIPLWLNAINKNMIRLDRYAAENDRGTHGLNTATSGIDP